MTSGKWTQQYLYERGTCRVKGLIPKNNSISIKFKSICFPWPSKTFMKRNCEQHSQQPLQRHKKVPHVSFSFWCEAWTLCHPNKCYNRCAPSIMWRILTCDKISSSTIVDFALMMTCYPGSTTKSIFCRARVTKDTFVSRTFSSSPKVNFKAFLAKCLLTMWFIKSW